MSTFFDDLNRANGPIGNGWSDFGNPPTIQNGHLYNAVGTGAYRADMEDTLYQKVVCHVYLATNSASQAGPAVKMDSLGVTCFAAGVHFVAPNYIFAVRSGNYGLGTILASVSLGIYVPSYVKITLEYSSGHLVAVYQDSVTLEVDSILYPSARYAGVSGYFNVGQVDDIMVMTGSATDLSVDPAVIGNYGECTELELTGVNTAWTPGTPGAPIFTVDHGTISAQTVNSATSATITYCPGDYLGDVVFTDPSTGETAGAIVTSDPTIVPPTGSACLLTEEGAATINRAEAIPGTQTVLTDLSIVIPAAEGVSALTMLDAIWQIWLAHYGTWAGGPPTFEQSYFGQILIALMGSYTPTVQLYQAARPTSIREELEGVTDRLTTLIGAEAWTLDDILHNLAGEPIANHQDILTAIAGISGGSNQDVLDMLAAMWGTSTPTLTQIAELISGISTIAGYNLGDVLDAIAAQDVHGHTEQVLAAIAALRGDDTATVAGSYSLLSDMNDALQEVKTSLQEIRAPSAYTFQDVLDAIAAIPSGEGGAGSGAPVWPGIAGVTIGPAWPLSTGLTVTAPMDGVVVQIVAVAPKLNGHLYTYHDIACYRNVGALAFVSDRGDVETYQALGFTQAIYTPRYLKRAAAVKVMCPAGTAGSVRAWTINP